MKVLVTGGAGYIGSTICSALIDNGHIPIILDSLINGCEDFTRGRIFYKGDIKDSEIVKKILNDHPDINHVIHCAALIKVDESTIVPFEYYNENVSKSISFFKTLKDLNVGNILFSSSASLYGEATGSLTEDCKLDPKSPYARTKLMMEMILEDFSKAYGMKSIILRYFNPIGADPKLRTGIYEKNPGSLLGKLLKVSKGEESIFKLTGTDWDTRDGSGIRDFIHVWDLALAHVKAIENFDNIFSDNDKFMEVINLGTGNGVTVKEFVSSFENINGPIPKVEADRRPGDILGAYTNCDKAKKLLNWSAKHSIEDAIKDSLRWTAKFKKGYDI